MGGGVGVMMSNFSASMLGMGMMVELMVMFAAWRC